MSTEHEYDQLEPSAPAVFQELWDESRRSDNPRSSITGVSIVNDDLRGATEEEFARVNRSTYEVRAGLDYLKVYVHGTVEDGRDLCDYLAALKEEAVKGTENRFFRIGDVECEMTHHGVGSFRQSHAFFFRAAGVEISVADFRPSEGGEKRLEELASESRPCAMIEIKGQYCYGRHHEELIQELYWWCLQLGIENADLRVSRLDLAVDVWGRGIDETAGQYLSGSMVSLSRNSLIRSEGRQVCSVEHGSSSADTKLRIYDKVRELSKNLDKLSVWESAYGELPEKLTRYEWQLKRKALLNEHMIGNVEELREKIADLLRYLMQDWYRETDMNDKRQTNRRREGVWQSIRQKAMDSVGGLSFRRSKRKKVAPPVEGLLNQGLGCFTRAAAVVQAKVDDMESLLSLFWTELSRTFDDKRDRTNEKIEEEKIRKKSIVEGRHSNQSLAMLLGATIRERVKERLAASNVDASDSAFMQHVLNHKTARLAGAA